MKKQTHEAYKKRSIFYEPAWDTGKKLPDYVDSDGKIPAEHLEQVLGQLENFDFELDEITRFLKKSPIHGRQLFRDSVKKRWETTFKNKPNSIWVAIDKNKIEKAIANGIDPYDYYESFVGGSAEKSAKTSKLIEFLTILFRIFSGVSF